MSKSMLNYWLLQKQKNWEFMGFAKIDDDESLGILAGRDLVVPLFVFKPCIGWGDSEPTSAKYPWVLYADGGDDVSYYMLFGQEKAAKECAQEYINTDAVIDFRDGEYKERKWQWQN